MKKKDSIAFKVLYEEYSPKPSEIEEMALELYNSTDKPDKTIPPAPKPPERFTKGELEYINFLIGLLNKVKECSR